MNDTYKKEIFQYQSDNECVPLCACGCDRPLLKGDRVLETNCGNAFLLNNDKRESIWKIREKMDKLNLTDEWQELDDELLVCKKMGCRIIKVIIQ